MALTAEQKNATMAAERAFLRNLFQAALQGDFLSLQESVRDYCRKHVDITATDVLTQFKDANRRTALHFACQSSSVKEESSDQHDIVEQMVSEDFLPASSSIQNMIRLKDKDGITPIMVASQVSDRKLAEKRVLALLKAADCSAASNNNKALGKLGLARSHAGATALHYAAGAGATAATVKALFEAGKVALGTSSRQGGMPLHWACAKQPPADYSETITALLDCGADLNAASQSNNNASTMIPPPLVMTLAAGNDIHAKLLIQQADVRNIDLSPTLNFVLPGGDVTVYHMAADMNMVGVLALLLEKKEKETVLSKKNHEGLSALDLAAREGHVGCVLLLLPGENRTEEDARAYIDKVKHKQTESKQDDNSTTVPPPKPAETDAASSATEEKAQQEAAAISASATDITDESKRKALEQKAAGNEHFEKKEFEQAVELYSQAIAANPTDATFYSNRSACYIMLGKPDAALHDAVIARSLRPDWAKAAYRMAVARLELGRYEDAALAAWEGLQQDQENEELKSLLQKCVKKGRKDFHESKNK